ncbi:nuclear mRNA export, poly(A)+RNA binding protein [Saitoella coloradoensis]
MPPAKTNLNDGRWQRGGGAVRSGGRGGGRGRGAPRGLNVREDREGDIDMGGDSGAGMRRHNPYGARRRGGGNAPRIHDHSNKGDLIDVRIKGYEGGTEDDFVAFVKRKGSAAFSGVRYENSVMVITVRGIAAARQIGRLDGFSFAGNRLEVTLPDDTAMDGPREMSKDTQNTLDRLLTFLNNRYQEHTKLLDLSNMESDPIMAGLGINTATKGTQSKMFPALMKLCTKHHPDAESVNLADNRLPSVHNVTALAQTYPKLKNLCLSNNRIAKWSDLDPWAGKNKFPELQELVFEGNPLRETELAKPNGDELYRAEMIRRFPNLRMLDSMVVVSAGASISFDIPDTEAKASDGRPQLPAPITPNFFEEDLVRSTVHRFVGAFYKLWDSNRADLTNYYGPQALFSISVNVQAPQGKSTGNGAFKTVGKWDNYTLQNRNLLRITSLEGRTNRLHVGPENIGKIFDLLPKSTHDLTNPALFCVDAFWLGGLTGPEGTDGSRAIQVMVHGEFTETVPASGKKGAKPTLTKRSFDRTFVIGAAAPGSRAAAIGSDCEIISDSLIVRAWGGHDAWQSQEETPIIGQVAPPSTPAMPTEAAPPVAGMPIVGAPVLPPGMTEQQAILIQQLMQATGLNMQFAQMCLAESGWDPATAMQTFESVRATIPPEAFVQ